ncbi:YgiQ family radical SAM protein [Sinanaerobacter sp. ZZT-01]|uniref:YgiQ family radical SAM protein n=1 Tax=Sinanaerobacter sp. ZZT-01 TaxID=3111540 RepID=UPI002D78B7BF|nr:YgiQ family radical SAM protein [Sinanaerobacter sp. ZZT-01]WRR92561.1 YgiQ family radical SAM protein [Sinanaerobacter sp. ZZT-01]
MFLPMNQEDMQKRGWESVDFVLVTGDAYVDHPSFGHAIISRLLERYGYRVAILSQPDWRDKKDFMRFGRPRLGFLVNSGNVDSMVNHYSVFKHKRKSDSYSPGGIAGKRPDRAVIVYSNRVREAYKDVPIIIGGLEASLRRFSHYDYWSESIRRSILLDAKADLLIYGMGERAVIEIAEALDSGIDVKDIGWIRGTVCKELGGFTDAEWKGEADTILLPAFTSVKEDKKKYAESFLLQYQNNDWIMGKRLIERYDEGLCIIQNPPMEPLNTLELDDVYELPYEGTYHPVYERDGGVPAIHEVKFSIVANRGCFGGCAFCALTYHQGREVRGRSKESIVKEARRLSQHKDFKGYIHDVGGPTANFRTLACEKQLKAGVCKNRDCLYPKPCPQMKVDHEGYLEVLREIRSLDGIKKVFIRSGIRFDYVMADSKNTFIKELCEHHVSGTLKVAPEHVSKKVLKMMRKPENDVFERFCSEYKRNNEKLGKKQYLIPYFISSHPGSGLKEAVELALYLKKTGFIPDQVQDFYPTPGTLATCMYYTEIDPFTMHSVYVAKDIEEKKMQRALMHFHKKENKHLVEKALRKIGKEELISILR